jgi:hypothetical protein
MPISDDRVQTSGIPQGSARMTAVPPRDPLPYSPAFEIPEVDESKVAGEIVRTMRGIAETVARDARRAFRPVHAKSHGFVIGQFEVFDGLAPPWAQGLFAHPGRWPVVMRLSTTPGDLLPDRVSTPRGIALKVIGVPGDRVAGSEGDVTQDFVMVNGRVFPAPGAAGFAKKLKLLAATTNRAPGLKSVLSAALRGVESLLAKTGHESSALKVLGGHPATHILGETFFSQVPLLYGRYMAKFSLAPASGSLKALTGARIDLHHDDAIREAVSAHFAGQGGEWELRAQLCTSLDRMPIEDASVEWPESESPFVPVARIRADPQTTWSPRLVAMVDEGMSFTPWHAIAAHRPLGSVMRVRKVAYDAAAKFRAERNGVRITEPRMLPSIED